MNNPFVAPASNKPANPFLPPKPPLTVVNVTPDRSAEAPEGTTEVTRETFERILEINGAATHTIRAAADKHYAQHGVFFVEHIGLRDVFTQVLPRAAKNFWPNFKENVVESLDPENVAVLFDLLYEIGQMSFDYSVELPLEKAFGREPFMDTIQGKKIPFAVRYPSVHALLDFYSSHYNLFDRESRQVLANYVKEKPSEFLADATSILALPVTKGASLAARTAVVSRLLKTMHFSKYMPPIPEPVKSVAKGAVRLGTDPGEAIPMTVEGAGKLAGKYFGGRDEFGGPGLPREDDLRATTTPNMPKYTPSEIREAERVLRGIDVYEGSGELRTPSSVVTGNAPQQARVGVLYKSPWQGDAIKNVVKNFYTKINDVTASIIQRMEDQLKTGKPADITELGKILADQFVSADRAFKDSYKAARKALLEDIDTDLLKQTVAQPYDQLIAFLDKELLRRDVDTKTAQELRRLHMLVSPANEVGSTIDSIGVFRTDFMNDSKVMIGGKSINVSLPDALNQQIYGILSDTYYSSIGNISPDIARDLAKINDLYRRRKEMFDDDIGRDLHRLATAENVDYRKMAALILDKQYVNNQMFDAFVETFNPDIIDQPTGKGITTRRFDPEDSIPPLLQSHYVEQLLKSSFRGGRLTGAGLRAELQKRGVNSQTRLLGDAYDQLDAVAKLLEQSVPLERVFTNSETAFNHMQIARTMNIAEGATEAVGTVVGQLVTGGINLGSGKNAALRMAQNAIGALTMYGMGAYEAFRQNHRPDLPTASNLHRAVEWIRRWHVDKGAKFVGRQALSRTVRRRAMNTREERELQSIIWGMQ